MHIHPSRLSSLADALEHAAYAAGCREDGSTTEKLLAEARRVAAGADVAIVCAGLPPSCESEGCDRDHMRMPGRHNRLVQAVREDNPSKVVVLMRGSPVETPWADSVKGILYAGLCRQARCRALARILTGDANPSGRLAESWPLRYEDCPSASLCGPGHSDPEHLEGVFVGYRYCSTAKARVWFAFGEGLSCGIFSSTDLRVHGDSVRATAANTGPRAGGACGGQVHRAAGWLPLRGPVS